MAFPWFRNIVLSDDEKKALGAIGSITTAKDLAKAFEGEGSKGIADFDYGKNVQEGYAKNPVVHYCVNLISDSLSLPRPELWVNGEIVEDPPNSHPLIGIYKLLQRPNDKMDWRTFIKTNSVYNLLAGEFFIRRQPDAAAITRGNGRLELIDPGRVKIDKGNYKIAMGEGKPDLIIPIQDQNGYREVLHCAEWAPDSNRGLSHLDPSWKPIKNYNEYLDWNYSLLRNSARAGIVAVLKTMSATSGKTFSPEQLDEISKELSKFGGPQNAGRSMVLSGDWDITDHGQTNREMEWSVGLESMAKIICWTFKVDPIFLGFKGDSTYNNKDEAAVGLYKFVVMPALEQFSSDFVHWMEELYPQATGSWEIRFNYDDIPALEPLREKKWTRAIEALGAGLLTVDEAREMIGYGALAVVTPPTTQSANKIETKDLPLETKQIVTTGPDGHTHTWDYGAVRTSTDGGPEFEQHSHPIQYAEIDGERVPVGIGSGGNPDHTHTLS